MSDNVELPKATSYYTSTHGASALVENPKWRDTVKVTGYGAVISPAPSQLTGWVHFIIPFTTSRDQVQVIRDGYVRCSTSKAKITNVVVHDGEIQSAANAVSWSGQLFSHTFELIPPAYVAFAFVISCYVEFQSIDGVVNFAAAGLGWYYD